MPVGVALRAGARASVAVGVLNNYFWCYVPREIPRGLQRGANQAFDVAQAVVVFAADEGQRRSGRSGAAGSANAMNVDLGFSGQIIVDDMRNVIDVALAALSIPFIPKRGQLDKSPARAAARSSSMAPGIIALVGCLAFNMGIMAVWAYMERIGDSLGLDASAIGSVLGASLLTGLFAALVAAAVGDRFGRALPIGLALVLQLVALVLLASRPSALGFGVAVMLFAFCWNFPVAYQLATTVSVDRSGRLVVLFLSAVKLGYALGPAIAGLLIASTGGIRAPLLLGAICFVASGAIFVPLARWAASPLEVR